MKKISAIFFDLGNTLIHYHEGNLSDEEKELIGLKNIHHLLKHWKIEINLQRIIDIFYKPWIKKLHYRNRKKEEYKLEHFIYPLLPNEKQNEICLKKIIIAFHEPFIRFSAYDHGLKDTLLDLSNKDIKIVLISNTPIPGFCHDEALKKIGIINLFEQRLYSYDLDSRKPNPYLFEIALKLLNVTPNEAIMIGDSIELDLNPASILGIKPIRYQSKTFKKEKTNLIKNEYIGNYPTINSINELTKYIDNY